MASAERSREMVWVDLGTEEYLAVRHLQRRLSDQRRLGITPDVVLVVEHPPCVTIGRAGRAEHVLVGEETLIAAGIDLHQTDRGGDVTYHGPGQLVCYPIVDLGGYARDVHAHVRRLEEVMIRTSAAFGVSAHREAAYPGVWTARGKIGAVGIGVRRWVTTHGASLNVCPCLDHYELIVPCGIRRRRVTSLAEMRGRPVGMAAVRRQMRRAFAGVFETALRDAGRDEVSEVCGPAALQAVGISPHPVGF